MKYLYPFSVEKPPDIVINPGEDQIVSIGDSLIITCQAITKRKRWLYWRKNNNPLPESKNIKVEKDSSAKRAMTFVKFSPVEMHDDGIYMCYGDDDLIPKEIAIRVVTSKNKMCSRDEMLFHYEPVLWPVALERSTITVPCPTSYHKGIETNMRRTCTENGVWGPVNRGKCQLASFREKLISLAKVSTNVFRFGPANQGCMYQFYLGGGGVVSKLDRLTDQSMIH